MHFIDRTNKIYGRLRALYLHECRNGDSYWRCICECGNEKTIRASSLQSGNTKSCGCLAVENGKKQGIATKTHGEGAHAVRTRTYRIWQGMLRRCDTPSASGYKNYGGRGICVCPEWRESYLNFKNDMGECPPGLSLDRIDNSKNYCKANCRWTDRVTQRRNSRYTKQLTFKGETLILSDWAKLYGIPLATISRRLKRGLPVEDVLFKGHL